MTSVRFHAPLVLLCILSVATVAQLKKAPTQKSTQTIQKPPQPSKVEVFVAAVRNAQSLEDVQRAYAAAGLSREETAEAQRRVEGTPLLKTKLESLVSAAMRSADAAGARELKNAENAATMHTAQMNQQRISRALASGEVLTRRSAAQAVDPNVRCAADIPSIAEVSTVTPGAEFAVEGKGFGSERGNVDLLLGGSVFPARILAWNSCLVRAKVVDDITRVTKDIKAAVVLRTVSRKEARAPALFMPALDSYTSHRREVLWGGFFGKSGDYGYFDFALQNDWVVASTTILHLHDGHAKLVSVPPINTPGVNAYTKAHAGVAAFGKCEFHVFQKLVGPKGLSATVP